MRIDIKKVKGKEYIQLVDRKGHIFHVGPATDYDSWLIALMMWEKEWRQEYLRKREETFNKIENEIGKHISIGDLELRVLDSIKYRDSYDFRVARKSIRIPRLWPFGNLMKNDSSEQQRYPYTWHWNERAELIQKRLKDLTFKQRRIMRKEEKTKLEAKKEEDYKRITDLRVKQEKRKNVLLLLVQFQMAKGFAESQEIVNEATVRYRMAKEETENILFEMLRDGTIYEPRTGCYRIT
jgi:hypothetical protein